MNSIETPPIVCSSDDELYKNFREHFGDLVIDKLDEDHLKSDAQKEKWRFFCEKFKDTVSDFNFGTLLRLDSSQDYSEKNSTIGKLDTPSLA